MGRPDAITKEYLRRPDIFTDVFNKFLHHGKQKILPEMLSDDEMDEFQTNFREVMKYIKYSSDRERLKEVINMDARFKDVERQAVDVINTVTGSEVNYSEEEEKVDMCQAIREIKEEGRREGRLEGKMIGVIRSNKKWSIPWDDTRQYLMEEYQKSGEEVDELMEKYWK